MDKSESKRRVLIAKIKEYNELAPEDRERRLQVLQLRFYLQPLMEMAPTNRLMQLNSIPAPYRKWVDDRLQQWDLLPPPLQRDVLETEFARDYFIQIQNSSPEQRHQILSSLPPQRRKKIEEWLHQLGKMTEQQRSKATARLSTFFELTDEERERTLDRLNPGERVHMELVLKTFRQLPPVQRQQCMESFRKFVGMTNEEREQFISNVERWREMTAAERKTWSDLVNALPPLPPEMGESQK